MEDTIKVNFLKSMLVLKIRETYKSPYHKNKFLSLKRTDCGTMTEFKKFLHQFTGNWSGGSYDIQFVLKEGNYASNTLYSTLVRIDIRDGKVAKIWKNSPYTGKEYPLWGLLKTSRAKRKDEKKKIAIKKAIKKKIVKISKKGIIKSKKLKKKVSKKEIIKRK